VSAVEKPAPLALVQPQPAALTVSGGVQINGLHDVFALAERLANARGFVPDAYAGKPDALAACILTGVELGLGPMQAMREIHIIKGKPSISATLMLALAQRAGIKTRWIKSDATIATIGVTVQGLAEQTMSFTAEEAKAAGLTGENWQKYKPAMLRARCTSAAIRAFCPFVIGGSVYESDSGELTDGVPAAQVVKAQVVETRREQPTAPAAKANLSDATSGEELHAFCTRGARAMGESTGAARGRFVAAVTKHAKRLGVDPAIALEWAGLEEAPHNPETGEVLTDEQQAAAIDRGEA